MQGKPPQSKPPPRPARRVSPAEWAWLDRINRQLAYDEYMQAKREYWLAAPMTPHLERMMIFETNA